MVDQLLLGVKTWGKSYQDPLKPSRKLLIMRVFRYFSGDRDFVTK